jgi:DNA-binding MarR family transcriptional regulator
VGRADAGFGREPDSATLLYLTDKGREIAKSNFEESIKHNKAILAALGDYKDAWDEIVKRLGKFIEDGYEVADSNVTNRSGHR